MKIHVPSNAVPLNDSSRLAVVIVGCLSLAFSMSRATAADSTSPDKSSMPITFTDAARAHWAFHPVKRPAIPSVTQSTSCVVNPIDSFILAKLKEKGLTLSPPASKATLIRRLTFDLIGLPPTPAEIDAFERDASPDAYERLVDRLLASPHYGERWGRHWLDLARFAESDGYEYDAARPNAWRYRDYVIRSFNADKPYDRFVREQVAGDELWPDDPDARVATGFNLLGPDMVDSSDQVQRHHNTLNDMTDTTALTFLGLTMACARCHDHKFEPILQRDYYSLQAFFTPAAFAKDQPLLTREGRAEYDAAMKRFNELPAARELTVMEAPVREKLRERRLAKLSPEVRAAHNTPPEQRTQEQANLVLETEDAVHFSEKDIAGAMSEETRSRYNDLLQKIKKLPGRPTMPMATALSDAKAGAAHTFILHRGEYSQPREEVNPAFPIVLAAKVENATPAHRADLAAWLTSPQNPLTARVMVNRIWQHHFGHGLVETPSDFGVRGSRPTHPELLDWLASEIMSPSTPLTCSGQASSGEPWSIKRMHKLILLSATYRQSALVSAQDDRAMKIDPENHLYWRINRQRLEGEVLRDSLLAISGQLNDEMGGPGVFPPIPADVFKGSKGWETSKDRRQIGRRSIYIFARRNLRFPFLEVFDAPDSNLSCPLRDRSTTAPQSLMLLNSDDVVSAAKTTADRLKESASSEQEQIAMLYQLNLGRKPSASELTASREFLKRSPMSEFCRAMFNLNEFVYVE
jgi:hypothetical protein